MGGFFDHYERFLETSAVGAWPLRLNLRHVAIVESNGGLLEGARVLDLASHDGRWSFAAIKAGASHVTGLEARADFVKRADETLHAYGIRQAAFRFEIADLNHLRSAGLACDVVFCLGYFYHTLNHLALVELMASTGARHFIIDTNIAEGDGLTVQLCSEAVDEPANGTTAVGVRDGKMLVGHPTIPALERMLHHFGYRVEAFDWLALLKERAIEVRLDEHQSADNPVVDYARSQRATLLATRG